METFYPSEIARLVLGYLKEVNCKESWRTFFEESDDLKEHRSLLKQGKFCTTNVVGKSLKDILAEYCVLRSAKENNQNNQSQCSTNSYQFYGVYKTPNKVNENSYARFTVNQKIQTQSLVAANHVGTPTQRQRLIFRSPTSRPTTKSPRRRLECHVTRLNFGPEAESTNANISITEADKELSPNYSTTVPTSQSCDRNPVNSSSEYGSSSISPKLHCRNDRTVLHANNNTDVKNVHTGLSSPSDPSKASQEVPAKITNASGIETRFINSSNLITNRDTQSNDQVLQLSSVTVSDKQNAQIGESYYSEKQNSILDKNTENSLEGYCTPQYTIDPPPYNRAPLTNSPRIVLSHDRSQIPSLTTPMKDKRPWAEEEWSPKRKGSIPRRRLVSESPLSKCMQQPETILSFDTILENLFGPEEVLFNDPFVQLLTENINKVKQGELCESYVQDELLDDIVKKGAERIQGNTVFSTISINKDCVESNFSVESNSSKNEANNESEKDSCSIDKVYDTNLLGVPYQEMHKNITNTNESDFQINTITDEAVNFNHDMSNTFDNTRKDVISNAEVPSNSNSGNNLNKNEKSSDVQETVNSSVVGIEINPAVDDLYKSKTCDNLTDISSEELCIVEDMPSDKSEDLNSKNNIDEVLKEVESNNNTENNMEIDGVKASKEVKLNNDKENNMEIDGVEASKEVKLNDTENNMEIDGVEASKEVKSNNNTENNIEVDRVEASKEINSKNDSEPDNAVNLEANQSTTVVANQNITTQIDNPTCSVPPTTTVVTAQLSNQPNVMLEVPIPTNSGFLLPTITSEGIVQNTQFIVITPSGMCMPVPTIPAGNASNPVVINSFLPPPLPNGNLLPVGANTTVSTNAGNAVTTPKKKKNSDLSSTKSCNSSADTKTMPKRNSKRNEVKKTVTKNNTKEKTTDKQDSGSTDGRKKKNTPRHPKRKLRRLFPDSAPTANCETPDTAPQTNYETPIKNPGDDIPVLSIPESPSHPGQSSAFKLLSQITGRVEKDDKSPILKAMFSSAAVLANKSPRLNSSHARRLDFSLNSNDENEVHKKNETVTSKGSPVQHRRSSRLQCSKGKAKDADNSEILNSNRDQQQMKKSVNSSESTLVLTDNKKLNSSTKKESLDNLTSSVYSKTLDICCIREEDMQIFEDEQNTDLDKSGTEDINSTSAIAPKNVLPSNQPTPTQNVNEAHEDIEEIILSADENSSDNLPELSTYFSNKSAIISQGDSSKSSLLPQKSKMKSSRKKRTMSKNIIPQTMSVSERDSNTKCVRKKTSSSSKISFSQVNNSQCVSHKQDSDIKSIEISEINNSKNVLCVGQDSIIKPTKKITDNKKNSISEVNDSHIVLEQTTCFKPPGKNIETIDKPVPEVSNAQTVSAAEQIPVMKTLENKTENYKKYAFQCSNSQISSVLEHDLSKKSAVKNKDIKTTVNSVHNDVSKQTSAEHKGIESVVVDSEKCNNFSSNLPVSDLTLMSHKVSENAVQKKPGTNGINKRENTETISRYEKQSTYALSLELFGSDSEDDCRRNIPNSVYKTPNKNLSPICDPTNTKSKDFLSKYTIPLKKNSSYKTNVTNIHSEKRPSTSEISVEDQSDILNVSVNTLKKDDGRLVASSPRNHSLSTSASEVVNNSEKNEGKNKTNGSNSETKSDSVVNINEVGIGDHMRIEKQIIASSVLDSNVKKSACKNSKSERRSLENIISFCKNKENAKKQEISKNIHKSYDQNESNSFKGENSRKDTSKSVDHQLDSKISSPDNSSSRTAYKAKSSDQCFVVKNFDTKGNNVNKVLSSPEQTTNVQRSTVISPGTTVNPLIQKDKASILYQQTKPTNSTTESIVVKENSLNSLKHSRENSLCYGKKTKSPRSSALPNVNNNCNIKSSVSTEKARQSLNQENSSNFTIKGTTDKDKNKIVPPKKRIRPIPVDTSSSEGFSPFTQHFPSPSFRVTNTMNSENKTLSSIGTKITKTTEVPVSKTLPNCVDISYPGLQTSMSNSEFMSIFACPASPVSGSMSPLKRFTVVQEFKSPVSKTQVNSNSPARKNPGPKFVSQNAYWKSGKPKAMADFYKNAFPKKDSELPISPVSFSSSSFSCTGDAFRAKRKLVGEETNSSDKIEQCSALNNQKTCDLSEDVSKESNNSDRQKNRRKSSKPVNKKHLVQETCESSDNEFENKCSEVGGSEQLNLPSITCEATTLKANEDLSCNTSRKRKRRDSCCSDTCETVVDPTELMTPVKSDDWLNSDLFCKRRTPVKQKRRKINPLYSSSDESLESSPEKGKNSRNLHDSSKLSPNKSSKFAQEASLQSSNANKKQVDSVKKSTENVCIQQSNVNCNHVENLPQNNLDEGKTTQQSSLKKTAEKGRQISSEFKVPSKNDFSRSKNYSNKNFKKEGTIKKERRSRPSLKISPFKYQNDKNNLSQNTCSKKPIKDSATAKRNLSRENEEKKLLTESVKKGENFTAEDVKFSDKGSDKLAINSKMDSNTPKQMKELKEISQESMKPSSQASFKLSSSSDYKQRNESVDHCETTRDIVESDIGRSNEEGSELAIAIASCERELYNSKNDNNSQCSLQELDNAPKLNMLEKLKNIAFQDEERIAEELKSPSKLVVHNEKMHFILSKINVLGLDKVLDRLKDE